MNLPSVEQYLEIVEKNPESLATLFNHRFIYENGKPFFIKGNHAIILKAEYNSKFYALRFFTNRGFEVFERYEAVQTYLNSKSLYWKIPFEFLDKEVFFDPAIKMDWINSFSLSQYLDVIINEPAHISKLQKEFITLSENFEQNKIAHGNLNMKHIRFIRRGDDHLLKLIDYDSMFIPSFAGKDSVSAGTPGFQHPMRLASDFSETIDRFSFWILITALEAFKNDPLLWINSKQNGFTKEQQILFNYRDLASPEKAVIFQTLKKYRSEALNFYVDKLIAFCNAASLDKIEAPRLYENNNSFQPIIKKEDFAFELPEISNDVLAGETKLTGATIEAQQPIIHNEKIIVTKERKLAEPIEENAKVLAQHKNKEALYVPVRKKKKPLAAMIVVAILLLGTAYYFVWASRLKKEGPPVVSAIPKSTSQLQQPVDAQKKIFTSENVSQFLFQLYQSYNKRDLSSILSNYADNLNQYYDAGPVSKNKLNGIIQDLFIKPALYNCDPDVTTLQFNPQGDSCKVSISVRETIKADSRSKTENYSSKIEYTLDSSFRILSEKNIE